MLLVLLVATVITYFQTKLCAAAARIKVEQERPTVEVFERTNLPACDPFFLKTQGEIIQPRKILYPVIEHLNLRTIWDTAGSRRQ